MLLEIKSIDVFSVIKAVFIISMIIHIIFGFGFYFLILLGANMASELIYEFDYYEDYDSPGFFRFPLVVISIMVLSFVASFFYSMVSGVFALVYNLTAKWAGGFLLNGEEFKKSGKTVLEMKSTKEIEGTATEV